MKIANIQSVSRIEFSCREVSVPNFEFDLVTIEMLLTKSLVVLTVH
jgi:hypothetical protein